MSARGARGQATAELALGLTLLVPVLMIGWSFAESGFAALKVPEAAESALWDATSDKLQVARANAQMRYADFDGRTSTSGGPVRTFGDSTLSSQLQVTCTESRSLAFTQPGILDPAMPVPATASCSARAQTRLFGGFSRPVCAAGRPQGLGGPCAGQFAIALDDGVLPDHNNCPVTVDGSPCTNAEYFRRVEVIWKANGAAQGKAALELVKETLGLGVMPLYAEDALELYVSSQGEDAPQMPFAEEVRARADDEPIRWFTTPFTEHPESKQSWGARTACYLGSYCRSISIEKP